MLEIVVLERGTSKFKNSVDNFTSYMVVIFL